MNIEYEEAAFCKSIKVFLIFLQCFADYPTSLFLFVDQTGFLQVYVSCKMVEVLQRNESRTQRVSTETIVRMNSKFEVPDGTKNEWEKNTVTMDTTSCGHEFSL